MSQPLTFSDWIATLTLEFAVSEDGDVVQRWVSPWELAEDDAVGVGE